jgi:O-antigen/teichoic acid export membrane protein
MKTESDAHALPPMSALSNIRTIVGNTVSILASDVITRAANFVLYALIARYLGTYEFGQLALGLTLFQSFQLLAVAGLETLITREVAKDRLKTGQYLVNSSAVVITASLLSVIVLVLFTRIMAYAPSTTSIILLLSLGLFPYSLSIICDAIFRAREKMQYIAYSNLLVNVMKITLAFLLLIQGYGLYYLAILLFFLHVVALGSKWWLLLRHIVTRPRLIVDFHFCITLAKSTVTFLGINGLNAVMTSLTVILLSKYVGEVGVGLFSAAMQLIIPVELVLQSVAISVYPMMCRSFEHTFQRLRQITERLLESLIVSVFPAVVGLFFLADEILVFLYGNSDFTEASVVLRIIVWTMILRVFAKVFGIVLVAGLREKVTLRILMIDLLAALIFGPVLISQFGLIGAAVSSVIVRIVDYIQHYVPVRRLFKSGIAFGRIFWKPIIPSFCMVIFLVSVPGTHLLLSIVLAGAIYLTVLSMLVIRSVGGIHQFRTKYLALWST